MSFGRIASAAAAVAAGSFGSMYYAASKPNKDAEPSLGFRSQSIGEAYLSSLQTGDLVFFSRTRASRDPLSFLLTHLAKRANGGDLEHVGVIVRHPTHHYPYVLERTWRGPALTTFEDRVLHSSSSDIMVRSFHFLRSADQEVDAQALVARELAEQRALRAAPLRLVAQWFRDVTALAFASLALGSLPRAAPPVRRVVDMDELAALASSGASADGMATAMGGADGATFAHDGSGTKVAAAGDAPHVANRVALAGELGALAKQLRGAEMEAAALLAQRDGKGNYGTIAGLSEADSERLLLVLKRRKFLANSVATLYTKYRALTARRLLAPSALDPLTSPLANPLFRDAQLAAVALQTLGVLPTPAPAVTETKWNKAAFESAFPAALPIKPISSDAATATAAASASAPSQLQHKEIDTAAIAALLAQFAPEACEFHPHNLRESSYLLLARGVAGAEQLVVESYRKPPWEVRTGRGGTGDDDEDDEFPLAYREK